LTTSKAAPEAGTYKCLECDKTGKVHQVTVKKGDSMPSCGTCGAEKGHWVKL
jgi:transcription elongation factor Elf1